MNLLKISMLSVMFIALTGFGQTAFAKAPDAKDDGSGTGWCDGLNKKGGLYSTCIRAHSAQNLVEHLESVDVEGPALTKAKVSLAQTVSDYEELAGSSGSALPGFASCFSAIDTKLATAPTVSLTWWESVCLENGGTESGCADEGLFNFDSHYGIDTIEGWLGKCQNYPDNLACLAADEDIRLLNIGVRVCTGPYGAISIGYLSRAE